MSRPIVYSLILCISFQYVFGSSTQRIPSRYENKLESLNHGIVTSLKNCLLQKEKMDCLKKKVIQKIDYELKSNRTISISDDISIKRNPEWNAENYMVKSGRSLDLNSWGAKNGLNSSLNELLVDKINEYVKSIVVQFKMNGSVDEARRKKHKGGMMMVMMAGLAMAAILGQLFLGKVALASGAALLFAKVALMLSILSGLKKSGGGSSEHVVVAGDHGHHHGAWSRSSIAQEMAYRAQAQRHRNTMEASNPGMYAVYEGMQQNEIGPSGA